MIYWKNYAVPPKGNNSLDTNFTFFIGFHYLHKCQMSFGTHFEIIEHNIQFFVLNKNWNINQRHSLFEVFTN